MCRQLSTKLQAVQNANTSCTARLQHTRTPAALYTGGSMPGGSPLVGTPRGCGAPHAQPPAAPLSAHRRLDLGAAPGDKQQAAEDSRPTEAEDSQEQPAAGIEAAQLGKQDTAAFADRADSGEGAAGAAAHADAGSAAVDASQVELQALRSQNAKLQQQVRPACQPWLLLRITLNNIIPKHCIESMHSRCESILSVIELQVAVERQLAKAAASEKADIEASLAGLTAQVQHDCPCQAYSKLPGATLLCNAALSCAIDTEVACLFPSKQDS